jgi:hypothetical protein
MSVLRAGRALPSRGFLAPILLWAESACTPLCSPETDLREIPRKNFWLDIPRGRNKGTGKGNKGRM